MCSLSDNLGSSGSCKPNSKRAMSFFVLFALSFFCIAATAQYDGGTGTQGDPYLIRTAEQLNTIGTRSGDWYKHFQLRADIDMSEYDETAYNIIGTDRDNTFGGIFDGNDHTISNFSLSTTHQWYTGLFGCVSGQIKNLGLINPDIFALGGRVGALMGDMEQGSATNCYVKGVTISADRYVGGLVGSTSGRIVSCYSTGSVTGNSYVGGLVGLVDDATVNACYSKATVKGNLEVGGLAGMTTDEGSVISNSFATGSVTGGTYVGGLAGQVERGRAYKCYSTGPVSGNQHVGGFTGYIRVLGGVTHCFWDTETSGFSDSPGGTGKTTAEMQKMSTFTDAGWDFWNIWDICEGTNYPVLKWQIPVTDFRCPDGVDFIDFAFFASHWLLNNCNASNYYCEGTDLDQSGIVDFIDLEVLADNWLNGLP
ncbi:MAG TPA: hypothetical protein DIU00_17690 [Phycisphaerales bacterium]|nr:hypothetical protein [Phycisphaerales bacterium]